MNINRIEELSTSKLKDLIKITRDIVKILYNKLDYNIRIGNNNEMDRITKFILDYENTLEAYETMIKNINEFNSVTEGL